MQSVGDIQEGEALLRRFLIYIEWLELIPMGRGCDVPFNTTEDFAVRWTPEIKPLRHNPLAKLDGRV